MRLRTIQTAYEEIRAHDPGTAITQYRIRQIVINGEVPCKKAGKKYLVDVDALMKYMGVTA